MSLELPPLPYPFNFNDVVRIAPLPYPFNPFFRK
jgi:hypothetical protein